MTNEKTLPQDESGKGQDIFSDGPVPATRDGRIKLATEKGGLKSCPASFVDEYLDWEIIKSDNPFDILYLDYRAYDRITRPMIDGNFAIIKKFWEDIAAKAMSSPPVAKKYGGMDSIRRYPQILQKAYTELTADTNALKNLFEQIIQNRQESLRSSIESTLIQGEYTPGIRKDMTEKGIVIGLTVEEVESLLIRVLKEKGFVSEREASNDPLSVCWYSEARRQAREEANAGSQKKELDSIIEGILADAIFEPRELSSIKEKGKQIGYTENEVLAYFEKKLLEYGFSPDPDADIKKTDAIHKKLSAIWRTSEKHLEVSEHKFQTFLDGKLHNGIYIPDDYVSITEAATGLLRRDAVKLKATLIGYLKEKGFKPAGEFKAGNDLTVEWKTNWANKKSKESESTATPSSKTPFFKVVLVLGIGAIMAGVFYAKKDSIVPQTPITEQIETKSLPTVEQPKEIKKDNVESPKPPVAVPNLNEEREKIRQEAEREALAKIEAERQRQEQINREKEIDSQRQEQTVRQREIDDYLTEGKRYFEKGKYELCIEKMREILKRDSRNREAQRYTKMATEKIETIKDQFRNTAIGGSE